MHLFFTKYAHSFKDEHALKLIYSHIKKAVELCENEDPSYCKELSIAYEMIEDYFEVKNIDPKLMK